jgi:hypothetical protein
MLCRELLAIRHFDGLSHRSFYVPVSCRILSRTAWPVVGLALDGTVSFLSSAKFTLLAITSGGILYSWFGSFLTVRS